jgi:hypothetical protein
MIKKISGVLRLISSCSNSVNYYIGTYYKIFGKIKFLGEGIIVYFNLKEHRHKLLNSYSKLSFIPKEYINVIEENDIFIRIKLQYIIEFSDYHTVNFNNDKLSEFIWNDSIIREQELDFYIIFLKTSNQPMYVFGKKVDKSLQ